jgi:hypothetical protein
MRERYQKKWDLDLSIDAEKHLNETLGIRK